MSNQVKMSLCDNLNCWGHGKWTFWPVQFWHANHVLQLCGITEKEKLLSWPVLVDFLQRSAAPSKMTAWVLVLASCRHHWRWEFGHWCCHAKMRARTLARTCPFTAADQCSNDGAATPAGIHSGIHHLWLLCCWQQHHGGSVEDGSLDASNGAVPVHSVEDCSELADFAMLVCATCFDHADEMAIFSPHKFSV